MYFSRNNECQLGGIYFTIKTFRKTTFTTMGLLSINGIFKQKDIQLTLLGL